MDMVLSPPRPMRLNASALSSPSPSSSPSSSSNELVGLLERQLACQQELNASLQHRLVTMSQQFFSAEWADGRAASGVRESALRLAGVGALSGVAGFLVAVLAFVLLCM